MPECNVSVSQSSNTLFVHIKLLTQDDEKLARAVLTTAELAFRESEIAKIPRGAPDFE